MSYRRDNRTDELTRESTEERVRQQRRLRQREREREIGKNKTAKGNQPTRKNSSSSGQRKKKRPEEVASTRNRTGGNRPSGNRPLKDGAQRPNARKKQMTRRKKKKSWKKRIVICILLVLLLAIAGVVAYAVDMYRKVDTKKISKKSLEMNISEEAKLSGEGYLNVALFGIDSREGTNAELEGSERTDSIMIASLNQETGEIKIVSVFRDTLAQLDDGSLNKINAAYTYGGIDEAVATLNRNLDLDIQNYATINFSALIKVIDDLGGVELSLTEEEVYWTNQYQMETSEITGAEVQTIFATGTQTLNGLQATAFCRIRYTDGDDYRRAERQREVLQQIAEKAKTASFAQLNNVINDVLPLIQTSFSLSDCVQYAKLVTKLAIVDNTGFPFDKTTAEISGAGDSVIADTLVDNVIQLHTFLFGADGYTPSSTVTSISNNIAYAATAGGGTSTDTTDTTYYDSSSYDNSGTGTDYDYSATDSGGTYTDNTSTDNTSTDNTGGYEDTSGGTE